MTSIEGNYGAIQANPIIIGGIDFVGMHMLFTGGFVTSTVPDTTGLGLVGASMENLKLIVNDQPAGATRWPGFLTSEVEQRSIIITAQTDLARFHVAELGTYSKIAGTDQALFTVDLLEVEDLDPGDSLDFSAFSQGTFELSFDFIPIICGAACGPAPLATLSEEPPVTFVFKPRVSVAEPSSVLLLLCGLAVAITALRGS